MKLDRKMIARWRSVRAEMDREHRAAAVWVGSLAVVRRGPFAWCIMREGRRGYLWPITGDFMLSRAAYQRAAELNELQLRQMRMAAIPLHLLSGPASYSSAHIDQQQFAADRGIVCREKR